MSFLNGVQNNPAVPKDVASRAQVELAGGILFMSDQDLETQLGKAGVPQQTADAIVQENASARIARLRASMSVLAVLALIALFASLWVPITLSLHAAWEYSWMRPPSRSRRRMGVLSSGVAFGSSRRVVAG
jgi:hypothetical protein